MQDQSLINDSNQLQKDATETVTVATIVAIL
jgi:hypothetical protein